MNKRVVLLLITHCSVVMLLTGCWDQINIEERGFVVGSAIDLGDTAERKGEINIMLTNQLIVPAGLGTPATGSGQKKAYTNLTGSGESMFKIIRKMSTQTSRALYFEHLKILVISEEVAKKPNLIASLLDLYIRDQEMRRGIKVLVSEGKAKNILEIEQKTEKYPVKFINMTIENSEKSLEVIKPVSIGRLHGFLLNNNSYVLPRVLPTDKGMEDRGVAVFHGTNNKMVGTLNGRETRGLNLIKEKNHNGIIKFETENHLMVFEITTTKSSINVDVKSPGDINISIDISAEGSIGEMFGSRSLLEKKYITEIEKEVSEEIVQIVKETVEKAQKELNADIFGISGVLNQKHYDVWQKIKNDWEQGEDYFSSSNIQVTANTKIRGIGVTDKAKDKKD